MSKVLQFLFCIWDLWASGRHRLTHVLDWHFLSDSVIQWYVIYVHMSVFAGWDLSTNMSQTSDSTVFLFAPFLPCVCVEGLKCVGGFPYNLHSSFNHTRLHRSCCAPSKQNGEMRGLSLLSISSLCTSLITPFLSPLPHSSSFPMSLLWVFSLTHSCSLAPSWYFAGFQWSIPFPLCFYLTVSLLHYQRYMMY